MSVPAERIKFGCYRARARDRPRSGVVSQSDRLLDQRRAEADEAPQQASNRHRNKDYS
jgi:hypothetical protein